MKIDIFGIIGEDYWGDDYYVSLKSVSKQLESLKEGEELTVYINSPGGSVFEGLAIANLLAEKSPTIKIIGEASSIASVIACAGKTVQIAESAVMLFHKPWSMAWGTEDDFAKVSKQLTTLKESIKTAYARKSNLSSDEIENLLDEDTYHSAERCKELGFADEVYYPSPDEIQIIAKAMNTQFRKFFNLNRNNFSNTGGSSIMDYEKEYKNLLAKHEAMQANLITLQSDKQEIANQAQALTAKNLQLTESIDLLAKENTAHAAAIADYQTREVKNQVELDLTKLSDKILPAENNADNNFALTSELLWLKGFDGEASALIGGKTPYERKIAEISARTSLNSLQQPLQGVTEGKAINVTGLDYSNQSDRASLAQAAKVKAEAEKIPFDKALQIIIAEAK
jgi:ATP-dependent Clp endopeptidase proteolytic subunit ClpP